MKKETAAIGPVVSAAHLAEGAMPALSEMEFALTVLGNAFQRWIVRCMAAAGFPGLGHVDVLILHAVNHRSRDKTLSDLCMMFNIEDTHVVTYALKKLEGLGLIVTGRRGKEKTVKVTEAGADCLPPLPRRAGGAPGFQHQDAQLRRRRPQPHRAADAGLVGAVRPGGARRRQPLIVSGKKLLQAQIVKRG